MAKRNQHVVPHSSGWIVQGASSLRAVCSRLATG